MVWNMAGDDERKLVDELVSSTRRMKHLDLDPVQVEIIRTLMDGSRTVSEIAELVYGVRRVDGSFTAYYSKLRRSISGLESSGFVKRSGLFGRGKPYHLTQHGVAKLASISPGMSKTDLFTHKDLLIYSVVPIAGAICWYVASESLAFLVSLSVFFFLLGIAATRSAQIMGRVM